MYIVSTLPERKPTSCGDIDETDQPADIVSARSGGLANTDYGRKSGRTLPLEPNQAGKTRNSARWTPLLVIIMLGMVLYAVFSPLKSNSNTTQSFNTTREVQVHIGGWIGLMVKNSSSGETSTRPSAPSHSTQPHSPHQVHRRTHRPRTHQRGKYRSTHLKGRQCNCSR